MTWFVYYERISHPGSGFKFEANEDGCINEAKLTAEQRKRLDQCREDLWQEFRPPQLVRQFTD